MPVRHSLSPRIHGLFAEQAGLAVDYRAIEVGEESLEREIRNLAEAGGRGCNITVPLKRRAFQLAARSSERAAVAQSANTLLFETANTWVADSTDGPGLLQDLAGNLGIETAGLRVCVVGAGGAAAAILYDLLLQGPGELLVFNRTTERAVALAAQFSGIGRVAAAGLGEMETAGRFDLVINATSGGHHGSGPALSESLFAGGGTCYDLNYGAAHGLLRDWCSARGIRCHDGLGMLVEQAALSFRIWTGFAPDTAPVRAALREDASLRPGEAPQ